MLLIAMAGLPGTGKSTIARRLAAELGGVVLDKDAIRIALFPPPALDYSSAQDDLTMFALYCAAERIRATHPEITPIIDGRTYRRTQQVRDLFAAAEAMGECPRIIECVCARETVRKRLDADLAKGGHPAGNRTFEMYCAVKETAEPLRVPRLTLDTGTVPLDECVRKCLEYLRGS